ncbi:MAG: DUF1330 domain-containing protein [Methyloligellaceae bacterium]
MAKGYWVVHITVKDPERYKDYIAADEAAFAKFDARFHVRGGENQIPEGQSRERHVVIEFESYEKALECYNSSEYQAAAKIRQESADTDLVIVEGVD